MHVRPARTFVDSYFPPLADGRDGQLAYDYLVIATGATHSYFGRDEWAEHAPV